MSRPQLPPRWIWVVLGVGGVLSLALFLTIRGWEQRELAQRAADLAQEQVERLRISVLRSMEVLHSIASLHAAKGSIDRDEFRHFVQRALERQPELAALSWNPVVPHAQRAAFEAAAAAGGTPCQFLEIGDNGQRQPARTRDRYVPVFLIEPLACNLDALGYDLNSDPRRHGALDRASATAQPVATAPIELAQGPANQPGILVLLPVYDGPVPADPAARDARLAGFAVAVFRVHDLVHEVFQRLHQRGIKVRLFDTSIAGELLYASAGERSEGDSGTPGSTAMLEVAGRHWAVTFTPTQAFAAGQSHFQSWIILTGGLLVSVLIAGYVYGGWRRTQQIGAANAAKSDFLASMSHEIRTPLNAILGYTQLMQREARLLPEQRDAVAGINASGRHLLGLINEILDLSKIEAGRMELNPVDFSLAGLANELMATFRPLCAQKRIRLRLELAGGGPLDVRGDEGKLRQVLINLLGNAVKFTSAGEVFLGFKPQSDGRWLFEVIDTGMGIPEAECADIFKPFHQGRSARHQGGTGLGLAIAHRQVALLGGELELQSERGFGSRFFFCLPLPPARNAVAAEPVTHFLRLAPGQSVRTLVVDDQPDNREVLGGLLRSIGCEVSFAANASETLAQARAVKPDLIFLDLLLPDQPGTEVARRLLVEAAFDRPKIVLHTASALARHREEALAAGCVDFLAKPITAGRLSDCLVRHLGVRLETAGETGETEDLPPLGDGHVTLPAELYGRLIVAAELHSTTALKAALPELRAQGREGRQLAGEIRQLMRSYDMDGIQRRLAQAAVPAAETEAV